MKRVVTHIQTVTRGMSGILWLAVAILGALLLIVLSIVSISTLGWWSLLTIPVLIRLYAYLLVYLGYFGELTDSLVARLLRRTPRS